MAQKPSHVSLNIPFLLGLLVLVVPWAADAIQNNRLARSLGAKERTQQIRLSNAAGNRTYMTVVLMDINQLLYSGLWPRN